ncbi:MAG: septum formation initiator family protein [Candidatus Nealsonbacteria bacterium]|nr:septum formation initiator family protein [Candidatus Nealsonbacteria bacterium]
MIAKYKKNQREDRQQLIFSISLGLALAVVVGFLVVSNFRINQKRDELDAQRDYLQRQLQILEEKRDQVQAQISEAAKEDYLETEARERFNLKKPGEEVVAVLPSVDQPVQTEEQRQWWNPFTW